MIAANDTNILTQIEELRNASAALEWSGEKFDHECQTAIELLAPFIDACKEMPAYPARKSTPITQTIWKNGPTDEGPVRRLIQKQLEGGIETASSGFMGYIPGGGLLTAALADLITAVTNRFSGFDFTAPGAARTESEAIRWLCTKLGLGDDAWGSFTSGATMATLNCFLAARESVPQEIPHNQLCIYMTRQVHHANTRVLKTIGLLKCQIRYIDTDSECRMIPSSLETQLNADRSAGLRPFMVIASAGTTNTGSIDPLDEISRHCHAHGVWLHVDGAYGGLFVLSQLAREKLRGIEAADSVVVDPQKTLFLPYGIGAGLVRNHQTLRAVFNESAPYLTSPSTSEIERSAADYSFELSRHNRAPRLSLSLDFFGEHAFASALDEKLLLAQWLYSELAKSDEIITLMRPQLTVCVFRLSTHDRTQGLLDSILDDGTLHISPTTLNGTLWLRACILSFRTHLEQVSALNKRIQAFLANEAD